jgi:hypothetical protein
MDWPLQSANKQMYTPSYRYIQFHITVYQASMPHTSDCLGLVAATLNWRDTHYNRSYMNPIQVYTAYKLNTVIPQPEGPINTLTNCNLHSMFLHDNLLKHCLNFCSMPATRLKQWVANKSDTLLWHSSYFRHDFSI